MAKGRKHRLANGLTPKQNAFTKVVLQQIAETGEVNGVAAAKQTYDVTDTNNANQVAIGNLQNPTIKKTIEEALNASGGNVDKISENLTKLANSAPEKISAAVVLKANVEMLKLLGAYPGSKTNKNTGTMKQKVETISFDEARHQIRKVTSEATYFDNDAL